MKITFKPTIRNNKDKNKIEFTVPLKTSFENGSFSSINFILNRDYRTNWIYHLYSLAPALFWGFHSILALIYYLDLATPGRGGNTQLFSKKDYKGLKISKKMK